MKLRGIDFGPITGASGVQGWFGEGYPYHRYLKRIGLSFDNMTLVAKTTTLHAREGNMALKEDGITPSRLVPKCIVVKPLAGAALNSIGLSGPGASALLASGRWQALTSPFMLSFMSVAQEQGQRRDELAAFCELLKEEEGKFSAPFGLQINSFCPNTDLDPQHLIGEVAANMRTARIILGEAVPLVPKFNALVAPHTIRQMQGYCDAVCVSNAIPYGKMPELINWKRLFGVAYDGHFPVLRKSPLAHLGGGELSGSPLLPVVAAWVREAKTVGLDIPINAGGGILSKDDVRTLIKSGLDFEKDSIFLGSVAFLRPWRVQDIINYAHHLASR